VEPDVEEDEEEEEIEPVVINKPAEKPKPKRKPYTGNKKSWGSTRKRFSRGSAARVENKAFIKNQMEKEDYVNGDYYHSGGKYYYSSTYNKYYSPNPKHQNHANSKFSTFTCSSFDWDCNKCEKNHLEITNCKEHEFCYVTDNRAVCGTCARWGKTCTECNREDGCTECGEHHWILLGTCWKSLI